MERYAHQDGIPRYLDMPSIHVNIFISFMNSTGTNENTQFRMERQFVLIIWSKMRPTHTTKDA